MLLDVARLDTANINIPIGYLKHIRLLSEHLLNVQFNLQVFIYLLLQAIMFLSIIITIARESQCTRQHACYIYVDGFP